MRFLRGLFIASIIACAAGPPPARAQVASITLDWTAPGDDGNVGTAAQYELRWRTVAPDTTSQATILAWWTAATVATPVPVPAVAGTPQSTTLSPPGGWPAGTYYFIIRAADEVPNWSNFSNVAIKVSADALPPARITDLRAR